MSSSPMKMPIPGVAQPVASFRTQQPSEDTSFDFTASPALARIREQVEGVAAIDLPVLLLGEKGVGKGAFARLIHRLSSRRFRPVRTVDCTAVPGELLETTLFGDDTDVYTRPALHRPGELEMSNKGTLVLEEAGEVAPEVQKKLSQVLRDRLLPTHCHTSCIPLDVRLLTTRSVDCRGPWVRQLSDASDGLAEDLFDRLSALTILVPPLRNRRDEIPYLLDHFMKDVSQRMGCTPRPVTPRLMDACVNHHWPGNLRELKNFVMKYLAHAEEETLLKELTRNRGCEFHVVKRRSITSYAPAPCPVRREKTSFRLDLAPAASRRRWAAALRGSNLEPPRSPTSLL